MLQDIIDALRRGTVPSMDWTHLLSASSFEKSFDEELEKVARGSAVFKRRCEVNTEAVKPLRRAGCERAHRKGFACAEVQISETETPLHRLETVYRRLMERLTTPILRRCISHHH